MYSGDIDQSTNPINQKPAANVISGDAVPINNLPNLPTDNNKSDKVVTIPANEWNALNEKVIIDWICNFCEEKKT